MTVKSLEIWEAELQIDRSLDSRQKIDFSLRLWSDHVPIGALLKQSNFQAEHCHCLGETIVIGGRSTNRIARRHYASLQNVETSDVGGLAKWLVDAQRKLDANGEISLGLRSGQIEGVIWIALFGDGVQPLPQIEPAIVASCLERCVKIVFENYTDVDADGLPRKTWLTI